MSQVGRMRMSLRAFPAISVVVALTFGLLASVLPGARAHTLSASQRFVACHQLLLSSAGSEQAEAHSADKAPAKHDNFAGCPDCCLAAHASAAVLPERDAAFAKPLRAAVARIRYFAVSEGVTPSAPLAAANGARAPPAA